MTRAEATAAARAALGAVVRGLWRTTVYLGPLLVAALGYLARLCADAVAAVRARLLQRARAKSPDRSSEYERQEAALREATARRWTSWIALPAERRFAVRVAALVLVVAVGALLRFRFTTPSVSELTVESSGALPAAVADASDEQPPPPPPLDMEAAATRFERAARTTSAGNWTFLTEGPVLAPGARGDWDGYIIASPWVLKEADGGNTRYRMWYRGCYFRGRDRGCAIGHATSADGIRWQKTKGPVFEPVDPGARTRLHGLTVVRSGDRYFLWYSVTPELSGTRKPSTLHLATSPDGLRWEAAGQVLATTEWGPHPMEPSALHDGRQFHLWFVDTLRTFESHDYSRHRGSPFLMHFTSPDGRAWQESGQFPLGAAGLDRLRATIESRRDGGFQAATYPDTRYLRFTSLDGNDWEMDQRATTTVRPNSFSRDVNNLIDATALDSGGGTLVWFVAKVDRGREEIRVAFRKAN